MLFDHLSDNKPSKIKRSTVIASIEQGGLAMIDVYEVHATVNCGWIRCLYDDSTDDLDYSITNICKSIYANSTNKHYQRGSKYIVQTQ